MDRDRYAPNNVLLMLAGAGLLWMGCSGFNGGAPYAANLVSSVAVLNTNISAATSLLVWTTLDVYYFGKPSVIGTVQGMITDLACITPGAEKDAWTFGLEEAKNGELKSNYVTITFGTK